MDLEGSEHKEIGLALDDDSLEPSKFSPDFKKEEDDDPTQIDSGRRMSIATSSDIHSVSDYIVAPLRPNSIYDTGRADSMASVVGEEHFHFRTLKVNKPNMKTVRRFFCCSK